MAIINETYFEGIIRLDHSKDTTKERLTDYIDYCEALYMQKLLGDLYHDYIDTDKPSWYASFIAKSTFEYSGKRYVNDIKQMIAYFTYFEFVKDQQGFNTRLGEQKPKTSNSESVMPDAKLVRAFNEGVKLYENAKLYLIKNDLDCISEIIEKINTFGI